jgi:uncharacterized protein YecA (UPF0149 family)
MLATLPMTHALSLKDDLATGLPPVVEVVTGTIRKRGYFPKRNELCPCGSGRKWKRCHWRPRNG